MMTKTKAEKQIIARQTEAEFAAEISRLKRENGKMKEAAHYQERAAFWAYESRERLVKLLQQPPSR